MSDETEIANLLFEYAARIDAGDFAGVAELFRDGRILTEFGEVVGYEAVLDMYRSSTRLYPDGTPRTRHITTNLAIRVEGDRARCNSTFTVMQSLEDFPLQARPGEPSRPWQTRCNAAAHRPPTRRESNGRVGQGWTDRLRRRSCAGARGSLRSACHLPVHSPTASRSSFSSGLCAPLSMRFMALRPVSSCTSAMPAVVFAAPPATRSGCLANARATPSTA